MVLSVCITSWEEPRHERVSAYAEPLFLTYSFRKYFLNFQPLPVTRHWRVSSEHDTQGLYSRGA